jgi:hypothetical protein
MWGRRAGQPPPASPPARGAGVVLTTFAYFHASPSAVRTRVQEGHLTNGKDPIVLGKSLCLTAPSHFTFDANNPARAFFYGKYV